MEPEPTEACGRNPDSSPVGLEAAQVILGHSNASTTEIYAERNLKAAVKIAGEVG